MTRRPERPRHGRTRRLLMGIAGIAIVPALLFLLEARRRRGERRPAQIAAPPRLLELAPPPVPGPEPSPSPAPIVVEVVPPVPPAPRPEPEPAPPPPRTPPIELTRPAPAVAAPVAPAGDDEPPRSNRWRLALVAVVAAIVVVIPTLLYVALSSSPSTREARPLPALKVVAYYPPDAGWTYMWTRFDAARIHGDLARAHELGFDTVRIFVPPSAFGFPLPSRTMEAHLKEVVAAAKAAHVKVGLSLFDRYEDYQDPDGSATWLRAVLGPYANDRTIAFVEVHNEIDPSKPAAMRWYRKMLEVTRQLTGVPTIASVPGRLGISGLHQLARALAKAPPDAYSLHYYGEPAYLVPTLRRAQQAVSPASLILGEVGYSTATDDTATRGAPTTIWAQQAEQSQVLRAAFDATRRLALPAPGIWALYDIRTAGVPPDVAAGTHHTQQSYGLLRADGSPKPAAADVRAYLDASDISTDFNAFFSRGGATGTGPQPADWRIFDGGDGTLAWDAGVGHTTLGSVRLSGTKGSGSRVPSYYQPLWSIDVRQHELYRVSVWARGSSIAGDDRLAVSWFDAQGRYLRQKESVQLPAGDPGWTRLTVNTNPPEGAAVLEVHLKSSNEPGTVWFDDVAIR